jgi:hypothetical protein
MRRVHCRISYPQLCHSKWDNETDPFRLLNEKFQEIYKRTKNITLTDRVNKAVIGNCND